MKDEDESTIEIVPTEDGVIVEFNFYREIVIELPEKENKNKPEQPSIDITEPTEEVSTNTTTATTEEPSSETNKTDNLTTIDSPKTYDPAVPLWVVALLVVLIFIIFSFY
jgi:actin-like ATPase involved in cell morphogenesis